MERTARKQKRKIVSLDIDLVTYQQALEQVIEVARSGKPGYVCFANAHMVVEAHKDKTFASEVNEAMLVLSDGMPIINVLESVYKHRQERVAGMDVMPDLMGLAERLSLKVFFFGTDNQTLEKIRVKAENDFPKLKIAGLFSPPFEKPIDDEAYIELIRHSGANIVFVALGCPKQEKWMAKHSHKLDAVLLGVGGAFPIYAQLTRRAPKWLRDLSLEWLYRLGQEPTRLFKRYFITNTAFLYLTIKQKIKHTLNRTVS